MKFEPLWGIDETGLGGLGDYPHVKLTFQ
jgi:hypothetical protein